MNLQSQKRAKILILSLMLGLLISSCKLATIRPLDPVTGKAITGTESQEFSAERYVAERWQDPIITTAQQQATELSVLLAALQMDSEAASQRYGRREGNSPYSFLVKGKGKVLLLDSSSRANLLKLDALNNDGQADISLAIGPVIKGTALRDALPFIKFNDFTNQLEFADVSKALHLQVLNEVITKVDMAALVGKELSFVGAFTMSDLMQIVVTPLGLEPLP